MPEEGFEWHKESNYEWSLNKDMSWLHDVSMERG